MGSFSGVFLLISIFSGVYFSGVSQDKQVGPLVFRRGLAAQPIDLYIWWLKLKFGGKQYISNAKLDSHGRMQIFGNFRILVVKMIVGPTWFGGSFSEISRKFQKVAHMVYSHRFKTHRF